MGQELDPRHLALARRIARYMKRRTPANVELADLEQAALLGLLDGLRKHPNGSGQGFEFYLSQRIRGAVLDWLRIEDYSTRRQRKAGGVKVLRFDDLRVRVDEYGTQIPMEFATQDESPEAQAIRRVDAAKAWTTPLNPTDLRMARAHFERGLLHREVAVAEGVSEPRVTQRMERARIAMRAHLTKEPPEGYITRATRVALAKERFR